MAWTERFVDALAVGGGTGTSAADPWTLAEAFSNSASGQRVNIKAGTYSNSGNTTTTFTPAYDNPVWWRGYKTSIGDLDNKPTANLVDATDIPLLQASSGYYFFNQPAHCLSGLSFTSSVSNRSPVLDRRRRSWTRNCRFTNTASGVSVPVVDNFDGTTNRSRSYSNCEFAFTSTASSSLIDPAFYVNFHACSFIGSGTGVGIGSAKDITVTDCAFVNLNTGIQSTSVSQIINCTFYNIADDAIYSAYSSSSYYQRLFVANCYFHSVTGFCIGGTAVDGTVAVQNNVYHNCSNLLEYVFENLQFDEATDSSDLFIDAASKDFTLSSSSSGYGRGNGFMLGTTSTDYSDIGAIQHQDSAGGGGAGTYHPLYLN